MHLRNTWIALSLILCLSTIFTTNTVLAEGGYVSPQLARAYGVKSAFRDADINHPYYRAAVDLFLKKTISGYNDGTIGLDKKISRAESAKIILKAHLGDSIPEISGKFFHDSYDGAWHTKYINYMYSKGYMNGYKNGLFGINDPVNFGQTLKIVSRTFGFGSHVKEEKNGNNWQYAYYNIMKSKNLLPPNLTSSTHWDKLLTRGELFEIIFRTTRMLETKRNSYLNQVSITVPNLFMYDIPVVRTELTVSSVWLKDLTTGAGFSEQTRPGKENRFIIFGHSSAYAWDKNPYGKVFQPLIDKLQVGQSIELRYKGKWRKFEILSKEKIKNTDTDKVYNSSADIDLVLFTCDLNIGNRWLFKAKQVEAA